MKVYRPFGELQARKLKKGDLVQWSEWTPKKMKWEVRRGFLMKMENKFHSGRMISVSEVFVFHEKQRREICTFNLRLVEEKEEDK